jgi:hypothetical protein
LVHFSPAGARTDTTGFPFTSFHLTVRSPLGVGTVPEAEVTVLSGCGSTMNVAKPGLVGLTPRT